LGNLCVLYYRRIQEQGNHLKEWIIMDGDFRQKINIELTEGEADCLLSWILFMEKKAADEPEQDVSEMVAMLFARLVGAYPDLMESENVKSFLKQHGQTSESVRVPQEMALIPRFRLVRQVEQELEIQRKNLKAELTKLEARETFLEGNCRKRVLDEESKYPTDRLRYIAVGRGLGSDVNYQFIQERKRKIKAELARISEEISSLSRNPETSRTESLVMV
jgi:hypothetical protein